MLTSVLLSLLKPNNNNLILFVKATITQYPNHDKYEPSLVQLNKVNVTKYLQVQVRELSMLMASACPAPSLSVKTSVSLKSKM